MEHTLDLTTTWVGVVCLMLFVVTYGFVIAEEKIHMLKSKPAVFGGYLMWLPIGFVYFQHGNTDVVKHAIEHDFQEFVSIFLFLISAMTYVNAMIERNVFEALRSRLVRAGLSLRAMFWITGLIAFCLSPVADNLTTALIMGAVVSAVGRDNRKFITIGCISVVVAANAGGAFSPFGDITTLMVYQAGKLAFTDFFQLFPAAVSNWLLPALIMSFAIPKSTGSEKTGEDLVLMKKGARVIISLFVGTIISTITFKYLFSFPPAFTMMAGLSFLWLYGYRLEYKHQINWVMLPKFIREPLDPGDDYDTFKNVKDAEWDTLFFFYGIIMCVGALKIIGHLALLSDWSYGGFGYTVSNIGAGLLSAIIDNIPVMLAILGMELDMSDGQWLLVTLTTGTGGSMLSIGSAAGVALMGLARGYYTFTSHLRWSLVIGLGYIASVYIHIWFNSSLF
ncbi:sodium:proton antiporter NhaD [Candidatus Kaiserbacteria bacterium]|nr:sodium:proton antiporter NhaD [Candidatus Kaiserbacteria bacterium]